MNFNLKYEFSAKCYKKMYTFCCKHYYFFNTNVLLLFAICVGNRKTIFLYKKTQVFFFKKLINFDKCNSKKVQNKMVKTARFLVRHFQSFREKIHFENQTRFGTLNSYHKLFKIISQINEILKNIM